MPPPIFSHCRWRDIKFASRARTDAASRPHVRHCQPPENFCHKERKLRSSHINRVSPRGDPAVFCVAERGTYPGRLTCTAKKKHAERKGTPMKSLTVAVVAAMALTVPAHASVIPFLNSVTADGSNFKFSYTGQLSPNEGVTNGSQLVIVDFAGYVPGTALSTLANVTASVSSTLPAGLL